ncbi:MAG TPA: 16S rRNA (cytidine(1402)-2'-O)-methyltransferase [Bacteroidales bacterium]|nr:16S rRNA (cytidine(1402)-2'-O)-methyltransferase [Bacteroidales bacterium]
MAKLYIIPTPIGNLEDLTFRALKILGSVDLLLAEDTRTTANLLQHYQVKVPVLAYHQNNEHKLLQLVIGKLKGGMTLGLVSDAGTPAISDPGFLLVRECIRQDIEVECLPGATAFVPALVNSGLPSDRFCFEGFLPQKKGRLSRIHDLAGETRTMVFYESPHRLVKTLKSFSEAFGETRMVSVSRELSKVFEETTRGTLKEVITHFENRTVKGEICIVLAGMPKQGSQKYETGG